MVKNLVVLCCLLLFTVSCSKDTEDKLMGKWQLREVVESNGNVQKVDTVWYNFQTTIFMFQIYDPASDTYRKSYGYDTVEGDKQLLLQLNGDPHPVEEFLPYTDWTSYKRQFTIEKLSSKELVLKSEDKQYIFYKF